MYRIQKAYQLAKEQFTDFDVDVDGALLRMGEVHISMHCWQGDDVTGFEPAQTVLGGGLAATGNYPGRARTPDELRADLEQAYALIPGRHRLNLHAIYAETGGKSVDRNELTPQHFSRWIDWAQAHVLGLDFNPTLFSHPLAESGLTLAHPDPAIRSFWIDHCLACRRIAASFGKAQGNSAVNNIWIPDGMKDTPADRLSPRRHLLTSLDAIFSEAHPNEHLLDAVEGKLFGLGSEAYVVGSHEFYLGYAVRRGILLCLDTGHYHPTEGVSDKLSAVLLCLDRILLHLSRGVRWDSDHVVTLTDELQSIANEIVMGDFLSRIHLGLDYFDASINRVAAWVIGMRNVMAAFLRAFLLPCQALLDLEQAGDFTGRLALQESWKMMPFGAIWDYYCAQEDVPPDYQFMAEIRQYEHNHLAQRQ
jgi:L-rhamnose isomerase